jgi:hypothetical protein
MLQGYSWTEMSNLDLEGKTDFLINAIIECLDVVCPIEKKSN